VGVGFPLGVLRKLVNKVTNGKVVADDYEVHVGAVTECGTRNRLSEALQNWSAAMLACCCAAPPRAPGK
jgi:hypothetical protein